jgi:hypothetical protein
MADGTEETPPLTQRAEVYAHRSNPTFEAILESRTAAGEAAFFSPLPAAWDAPLTSKRPRWSGPAPSRPNEGFRT